MSLTRIGRLSDLYQNMSITIPMSVPMKKYGAISVPRGQICDVVLQQGVVQCVHKKWCGWGESALVGFVE